MIPARFPSFGLRDPAFLQQAGAPPAPIGTNDPDTWVWYKATDHITYAATRYIGDKMDTTTNKASTAAPNMNLTVDGAGAIECTPYFADNRANFLLASADFTSALWTATSVTKDTATTFTFTASGGRIRQGCYWLADEPGKSYTFKFWARNISGNANIHVYHLGSATGNTTALALTGVLTEYTVTFLAPAAIATSFEIGFQDNNGAGFGQIEVVDPMVYRTGEHSGVYIATSTTLGLQWPLRLGVPAWGCGFSFGTGGSVFQNAVANRNHTTGLMTIYLAIYVRSASPDGYICNSIQPSLVSGGGINPANRKMRIRMASAWSGDGADSVPYGQWVILTYVLNGASSEVRLNKNAATTIAVGALGTINRIAFNGSGGAGVFGRADYHEAIIRYTADNTATQNLFINYLAGQVGISV